MKWALSVAHRVHSRPCCFHVCVYLGETNVGSSGARNGKARNDGFYV